MLPRLATTIHPDTTNTCPAGSKDIPVLVRKHHIDQVIIAIPASPGQEIRAIKSICDEAGVTLISASETEDGEIRWPAA